MLYLLFTHLVLSLDYPQFIQFWDQNIRVDISSEAVVVPRNETTNIIFEDSYQEDYCQEVFLDDKCLISEEGCVGRKVIASKSPSYESLLVDSISVTLYQGIINNLIEKTGDKYYISIKDSIGRLYCYPVSYRTQNPILNEGVIVPRFIQMHVDVGPMYYYFEIEFKSSKRIPAKYIARNIQNSFTNGFGSGNMVYTIRDFDVSQNQSNSPKLIFQQ
ncbi:hypothetical protein HK103_002267 [Boothiomyces macroporosus]|uniref:Uncharacterized protein n=1 Tax=Boothiomyces macroporosus TaxID=261099 RepID=A0AAD5Y039_9FUNG|nr:hypothetical protein HK103_002267 [Boothiomyces macroporosus]